MREDDEQELPAPGGPVHEEVQRGSLVRATLSYIEQGFDNGLTSPPAQQTAVGASTQYQR